ncbi:hypothetical protein O0L34_g11253 [Tuta absoluta]|nr:hypothetical protein O0L34_g2181 [Tuta absoluta]KAJ2949931.1 hypothetical protein O0L34_g11253 [Tuta absoluta]
MAQFSLSWESHKSNICSGLSTLQQNGEFVDMTLAADGHHVKVHRMVMSLVSPYLKELLNSAPCQHPVIFLNKISYTTLCAILEYVYTGEVMVGKDSLTELIDAGKELHIRGLEDMKIEIPSQAQYSQSMQAQNNEGQPLADTGYFSKSRTPDIPKSTRNRNSKSDNMQDITEIHIPDRGDEGGDMPHMEDDHHDNYDDFIMNECAIETTSNKSSTKETKSLETQIQYTISNQGALQMILNRYMYYLRYTSRKEQHGHRSWKCINYTKKGTSCPATVITRDDVVIKRFGAHNHPFHDKQILKKVRDNAVFSAINEAELKGNAKKVEHGREPAKPNHGDTTDAE